ncbi:hypothetical protein SESBI_39792 [Sesbania bispinosa]|nr:hypothetical protein SESBI_39792 [Sesbania bispinosa]
MEVGSSTVITKKTPNTRSSRIPQHPTNSHAARGLKEAPINIEFGGYDRWRRPPAAIQN